MEFSLPVNVRCGSFADMVDRWGHFRSTLESGRRLDGSAGQPRADSRLPTPTAIYPPWLRSYGSAPSFSAIATTAGN